MPMEERTRPCDSRKWPSAARPGNRCAYFEVPAAVADVVIAGFFLGRGCWGRVAENLLGQYFWFCCFPLLAEAAGANRRAGFCDTASLSRGKRFRRRAD